MEHNFGNQFAMRRTRGSTIWLIRLLALAFGVGLLAGGIYFISNPIDPEDTIMGVVALVMAGLIPLILWIVSNNMKAEVAIHEEGVIVKKGKKIHQYHYSEIAGLQDQAAETTTMLVGGGIGGAISAGIAAGVRGAVKSAVNRKNRNRPITIVTKSVSKPGVSVIKAAGDILSGVFTEWFIKNNNITKETIRSMELSFGDNLKLKDGVFTQTKRNKVINLAMADITNLEIREDSVMFFGLNEKGKDRCLIDINIVHVLNIDLLFEVMEMSK
ncbi:MAG: hypothetical protein FWC73_09585 [Defluviitaleaceae bacterium]|nr:hypothetical protein [Defluviitaleaceae bacterium]